uniref:Putative entry exclusion protein n=1 Tax=Halomonas sp. 40 TaxID=223901 RepID=A0A090AVG8_9GAMM|nr:entry exclusion protein 1 [Halomonas sp. 40]BAP60112.1 putative entry exclusion protein [Halomonas sp. 40]
MAWHTVKDAQALTGKSRRTLYRDMAKGLLSWGFQGNGQRCIETSELLRVYGELKDVAQPEAEKVAHSGTPQNDTILAELTALRTEVHQLRDTLHRLEPTSPSKPSWWQKLLAWSSRRDR